MLVIEYILITILIQYVALITNNMISHFAGFVLYKFKIWCNYLCIGIGASFASIQAQGVSWMHQGGLIGTRHREQASHSVKRNKNTVMMITIIIWCRM
jgi:hypothetical protein